MSKQGENKDKGRSFQEKVKEFLKIGKEPQKSLQLHVSSALPTDYESYHCRDEHVITPQIIKDLSIPSSQNTRLKTLKDISDVRLGETTVVKLWKELLDLIVAEQPQEVRHQVLYFFSPLLKQELQGITRALFFKAISSHNVPQDVVPRLEMFDNLTDHGKNIEYFEEETGPFMLKWMPEVMSGGKTSQFLPILINVIKYNAAYLDEEIVAGLVKHTCILAIRSIYELDIRLCLNVLETVVCYSFLPNDALLTFIEALCRIVNHVKFPDDSLRLMRKFLGTNLGHSGICVMCRLLQDPKYRVDYKMLRGAVFFIGMCLWGSQKVPSLKHSPSAVLPSFLTAMQCSSTLVIKEILLSVDRLIRKYGREQELLTWELVIDVLESHVTFIQESQRTTEIEDLDAFLHATITAVEELNEENEYLGSVDRLFDLVEMVSETRPEPSVIKLIQYQSRLFYPTQEGWIDNIVRTMDRYYKNEKRPNIRIESLHVLSSVLCATRYLYEDELLDCVVTVFFSDLNLDPDRNVRNVAVQLLVDLAVDCTSNRCIDLLEIIKKVVNHPFNTMRSCSTESDDIVHIMDESELKDVETGVKGLIDIIKKKIHRLPSTLAVMAHCHLVSHIMSHYEKPLIYEQASSLRLIIMKYLLNIRANSLRQIGILSDDMTMTDVEYSSYLLCDWPVGLQNDAVTNGDMMQAFPTCPVTELPMTSAFKAIIRCLEKERDWCVLEMTLKKLPLILQNKTLILSNDKFIKDICRCLCSMVSQAVQLKDYQNLPSKFSGSDFHLFVFPTLAALPSYYGSISVNLQQKLVECLQFGRVSRCASICINALTDCTLEMQDVMNKSLPHVLLNLSQISATITVASAMLEFLSTLIMIPALYSSFVETQYMSIFAIALPYTNPFKFNHYIVSLAHHVIAVWFLKCRLPYRRNFAKYITKGLDAYIVAPVEDSSDANSRRRSSSLNESQTQSPPAPQLAAKRASLHPNNSQRDKISSEIKSPLDEAMMKFHLELTDTCSDFLARYAFSTCSALPFRSPLAEFLLKGGQKASWLMGTTIVIITTSGCGSKVLRQGLCQECHQLCRKRSDSMTDSSEEVTPIQKHSPELTSKTRRRHQSAAVTSSNNQSQSLFPFSNTTTTKDDSAVGSPKSLGNMLTVETIEPRSRKNTASSCDSNKSADHMLTQSVDEPQAQNIDKLMFGSDKSDGDNKSQGGHPNHLCSCWCQGWAEVQIRRPTGNTSWMMRIQNHPNLVSSTSSDFPLADIASLFLPSKMDNLSESSFEMYNVSGHKRIDSESLGENEYDAIHQEHFESSSPSKRSLRGMEFGFEIERSMDGAEGPKADETRKERNPSLEDDDEEPIISAPSSPRKLRKAISLSDASTSEAPKSPRKLERIHTIHEDEISSGSRARNSRKSLSPENWDQVTSQRKRTSSPPLVVRKAKSPPTSPSKDASDLQPMPRGRLHTISVMTPTVSRPQYPRSTNSLKREIYKTGINPSFVFLQLFHNGYFGNRKERPLLIPKTVPMDRALDVLDLIPPYETHKIGVIYIDKGQENDEVAMLSNEYGSIRYINFLSGIGTLIRFKDIDRKVIYTGGLDLDEDGKFTYMWKDDIMQVLFHVATLMPTTKDSCCRNKKRHIGNDFVSIIYNDSGKEFKITTIKGQFCYACVVIEPVDHQSNIVTIQAKPDVAEIIGNREQKIVSDQNLAIVVRQLALHANLASRIHRSQIAIVQNPFSSNWLERLRKIKELRQKIIDHNASDVDEFASSDPSASSPTSNDFTDYV